MLLLLSDPRSHDQAPYPSTSPDVAHPTPASWASQALAAALQRATGGTIPGQDHKWASDGGAQALFRVDYQPPPPSRAVVLPFTQVCCRTALVINTLLHGCQVRLHANPGMFARRSAEMNSGLPWAVIHSVVPAAMRGSMQAVTLRTVPPHLLAGAMARCHSAPRYRPSTGRTAGSSSPSSPAQHHHLGRSQSPSNFRHASSVRIADSPQARAARPTQGQYSSLRPEDRGVAGAPFPFSSRSAAAAAAPQHQAGGALPWSRTPGAASPRATPPCNTASSHIGIKRPSFPAQGRGRGWTRGSTAWQSAELPGSPSSPWTASASRPGLQLLASSSYPSLTEATRSSGDADFDGDVQDDDAPLQPVWRKELTRPVHAKWRSQAQQALPTRYEQLRLSACQAKSLTAHKGGHSSLHM